MPSESEELSFVLEQSAETYHRARLAFEKCVADVESADKRMRRVRKQWPARLPHEHYEHMWSQRESD